MNHLVTYCSNEFVTTKKRVLNQATRFGQFSTINQWMSEDLPQKFRDYFEAALGPNIKSFVWKPYIITETYKRVNQGDVIVYMDSGCMINCSKQGIKRFNEYVEMLKFSDYGCLSFQFTQHKDMPKENRLNCPYTVEQVTTVREIFEYFNTVDDPDITDTGQLIATTIILKKCDHGEFLLNCWLQAAYDDYKLFTDDYVENNKNNPLHCGVNRHDQSVFSVIRKKHGSILLNDETKFPTGVMPTPDGPHNMLLPGSYINRNKYPFWACRSRV